MFCPNCGSQNADGAAFCHECGTPLNAAPSEPVQEAPQFDAPAEPQYEAPAEPQYEAPAEPQHEAPSQPQFVPPVPPQYQPPAQPQYQPPQQFGAPSGALAALKKLGSSTAYLIAAIALSLSAVLNFIGALVGSSSSYTVTIGDQTYRLSLGDGGAAIGSAIAALVPALLILLGVWLTYGAARKRDNSPFSTGGLTLLKVIYVIEFVCVCVGFGFAIIGIIALIIGASFIGDLFGSVTDSLGLDEILKGSGYKGFDKDLSASVVSAAARIGFIIALVVVVAVFVFCIFFFSKLIKTINTGKRVAKTGVASDKVSPFVAVMLYIAAGFSALSALGSLVAGMIFSGLAGLCSATAVFIFALLIFKFRTAMRREMAMAPQGAYQQPYGGAYQQQTITNISCPRCRGIYASNLPSCPYCGQPR